VLLTDEAVFTNHGNVNLHNMYFCPVENLNLWMYGPVSYR